MEWSESDIANSYSKLSAENAKIKAANKEINAQISGIDVDLDSIKNTIISSSENPAQYNGQSGEDLLQQEAERILRENQNQVATLQGQLREEHDLSQAKHVTIDEITHLIDKTRQEVKNGNADPALLAELHELTASISKNTNKLTAFETKANEDARNAAKNDSSSSGSSGGDKK